jgi:putative FmdB family regulatory protein
VEGELPARSRRGARDRPFGYNISFFIKRFWAPSANPARFAMPIYEYRCSSCGHELEALQKLSEPPLVSCPACAKDTLVKLVSAAGFQLKGSGWYATDFKGSGAKPAGKSGDGDAKSDASKSESGSAKAADTKSDAASPAKPAASGAGSTGS